MSPPQERTWGILNTAAGNNPAPYYPLRAHGSHCTDSICWHMLSLPNCELLDILETLSYISFPKFLACGRSKTGLLQPEIKKQAPSRTQKSDVIWSVTILLFTPHHPLCSLSKKKKKHSLHLEKYTKTSKSRSYIIPGLLLFKDETKIEILASISPILAPNDRHLQVLLTSLVRVYQ